jgi:hypothetical protein
VQGGQGSYGSPVLLNRKDSYIQSDSYRNFKELQEVDLDKHFPTQVSFED